MSGTDHLLPVGDVWEDVDEHRVTRWIHPWDGGEPWDAILMGAPFTSGNTHPTMSWAAPAAVRAAFVDYTTYSADYDVDLFALRVADAGDISVSTTSPAESLERIEGTVARVIRAARSAIPVVLGGDHSITAAAFRGFVAARDESVGLIYFDSHTDVRAPQEGVALAGSAVRSILESAPGIRGQNVVEVGVHGFMNSSRHRTWLEDRGARIVSAREVRRRGIDHVLAEALAQASANTRSVYVSVDVDVLRQTDGIGAAGRISADGLEAADLLDAIYELGASPVVKMLDIVELDPRRDTAGITTRVAASLVLTFLGGLMARQRGDG